MKKYLLILPTLIGILLSNSCLKESNNDYPNSIALTTVHLSQTNDKSYYFSLDNGKTIYPGDTSRIGAYDTKNKEGQRAIIYFSLLEQPIPSFDYNVSLYRIYDVQTKKVDTAASAEELKSFGDEAADIANVWIGGGYLNLEYYVPQSYLAKKFRLSLVDNQTVTQPDGMPEGYIYLEFRCAFEGSEPIINQQDYISFKLDSYDPERRGAKGIYLRIRPSTGGVRYIKLEPAKSDQ